MEYVIVSTSGSKRYLTKDNVSNRYVAATNVSRAIKFDTLLKAKNVIENCLTNSEKDKWKVANLDDSPDRDIKVVKTINKINPVEVEWMSKITELDDFKKTLNKSKSELNTKLSYTDRELSDVYHFIKDNSPPAHIRAVIYGIEQGVLQRRAKIKEQLRYIDVITNIFNESFKKEEVEKQLKEVQDVDYKNRTDTYYKLEEIMRTKTRNKIII